MRILHLVHQYPPDYVGGTELYTQRLAIGQAIKGHNVAVFCPSPLSEIGEMQITEEGQGVHIYRVPLGLRSRTQVFRDTFRQRRILDSLKGVLRQESPDIVHVQHLMGLPTGLIEHLVEANIPYVVTMHDYWYFCANAQLLTNTDQTICEGPDERALNCGQCALARAGRKQLSWMATAVAPLMQTRNRRLRAVLDRADRVIAPTEFVYHTYARAGISGANMVIIRHGIELPEEELEVARRRREFRKGDGCLRIGYVGSIGWQKGIHILIEAVNTLPPERVQLTLYGDPTVFPDYVASLRDKIQHPSIDLAGPVSREDLWLALAEFDVVVMPTLWFEVSPLTIDEVFAVGVPIVASRIGAMTEKINDGVNGRLFPTGDVVVLRQILSDLLDNPELLDHWRAGIRPVRRIDEHMADIEKLYQLSLNTV
ncbi:MAG: glycosyltransferase [Chloroflexi bacterium]|nr:glycosyltransferase [Chloroflexota bacterium]